MDDSLEELATEAFVYGFPLVEMAKLLTSSARGGGGEGPATNVFRHRQEVVDAERAREWGVVTPNNDTLYSLATVDVGPEPIVLRVPPIRDRYYVFQLIDPWTNNFAYVGRRTIGEAGGEFLLVPPGWAGEPPAPMTVIPVPTTVCQIGGRILVDGEPDVPAVVAIQERLALIPLSRYPEAAAPEPGRAWPVPSVASGAEGAEEGLAFWESLRLLMAAFPPHPDDRAYQRRFEPLGLLDRSPSSTPGPAVREALLAGQRAGAELIEQRGRSLPLRNHWLSVREAFDYNVHFLEFGTVDSAEWKIEDPAGRYVMRAVSARLGIGGNHAYEAYYPLTFTDADGEPLSGEHRYLLHFDQPPPVDGFWSLSMYDVPAYLFVDNPIDRYSIGDRTPGLRSGADGSLDLFLQHDQPDDPAERANWLPAPEGPFRPCLRMYIPRPEAFDDERWRLPAIARR